MNAENYPTWLVSIDIAKELKEIDFNERCLFALDTENNDLYLIQREKKDCVWYEDISLLYEPVVPPNSFLVPTWEQALAWFRAKGYYGNLEATSKGTSAYIFTPKLDFGECWEFVYEKHYEKAREALLLKLIDLYKVANQ